MSELAVTYDNTKVIKRKDFDVQDITDSLMGSPFNVDISNIIHTPNTVIVKLPKEEYTKQRIGNFIMRRYNAHTVCKDDMLIFHPKEI